MSKVVLKTDELKDSVNISCVENKNRRFNYTRLNVDKKPKFFRTLDDFLHFP